MKRMKQLASLALALVLALGLTVPAWATGASGSGTDDNGKITVTNTVKDQSYSIYRIFDLESFSYTDATKPEEGAYSYKVSTKWAAFFAAEDAGAGTPAGPGLTYVNIDTNGYVTWKTGASAAEFAKAAIEFATADATKIEAEGDSKTATADNASVEFTNLPLGYYLVDSSLGALCNLTTTNQEVTVTEKNAAPTLTKQVQEDSKTGDAAWGEKNDAAIGETVNFRATITVEGVAKDYVMHDQMDDGLTFGSVTKVEKTSSGTTTTVTPDGNYTVTGNASHTVDGTTTTHTFDVTFSEDFCKKLNSGDVIVVSYTATLNANAEINVAESNKAHLEYKDNSGATKNTLESATQTFTWGIPVFKYTMKGTDKAPLGNAKFTLYKTTTTAGDTTTYSDAVVFATTSVTNTYEVAETGSTEITTDGTGRFQLNGLDSGTYYLKETEAPAGYNKLDTVVTVVISDEGKINVTAENTNGVTEIEVENKAGALLPETGGMGTTVFYVVGGVLAAGAAVLLITKKRMKSER